MQKYDVNFLPNSWGNASYFHLKEFHLADGAKLSILSDATRGVFALLSKGREQFELPPDRIIGLPQNKPFCQLKKFLDHTFVIVNAKQSGLPFCRFQQKGLGGGSFPYTIQYGPGAIIQNMEINECLKIFTHTTSGGPGTKSCSTHIPHSYWDISNHRQFSIMCQKVVSDEAWKNILLPQVKIRVFKKDHYETEIVGISGRLVEIRERQLLLREQKRDLEQIVSGREALMTSSQSDQELLIQLSDDREKMVETTASIQSILSETESELRRLETQRETHDGQIAALVQLIDLIDQLQMTELQSAHPALAQFRTRTLFDHRIRQLNQPISDDLLGKAVRALAPLEEESKSAAGKHVIALMGLTGAGKSTIVNHLLGIELARDPMSQKVRVAPGQEELAAIGHNSIASETYKTVVYERVGIPFTFADCGGFLDTRGTETELTVVTSLKLTLKTAASLRVLLCFDTRDLEPMHGQNFKKTLEGLLKNFFGNYHNFGNAFAILFNRTVYDPADGKPYTVEDLKRILAESEQELRDNNDPLAEFYTFALREGGRHIYLCDPLAAESRDALHLAIRQMYPVETDKHEFLTPYSDGLLSCYLSTMIDIANVANDIYSRISTLDDQFQERTIEHSNLATHLKHIEQQLENVSKRAQVTNNELAQIPHTIYSERISQLQADLEMLSQEKKNLKRRFKEINTSELMIFLSWGNGWLVSDGKGFYDYHSFVDPLTSKHPDVAASLDQIGFTLGNLGAYHKSLIYRMRALEMRREINDPDLGTSLHNVGTAHAQLGNNDEALRYLLEAVELKAAKPKDVSLAISLVNLGLVYSDLKQYESALHHQKEADKILRATDDDHRSLIEINLNNIGTTLLEMGKNEEALGYLERSLSMAKDLGTEKSTGFATSLLNIGVLKGKLGKHEEALVCQTQAADILKEKLGEHHPDFAKAMRRIGMTLRKLKRYEEAVDHLKIAVQCLQNHLEDEHHFVIDGLIMISWILSDLERYEESLQTELKVLKLQKLIYGEKYLDVAIRLNNVGMAFHKLGRNEEALEHLMRSFILSCEILQNFHPLHDTCLHNIVVVLPLQTNMHLSEKIRQEVFSLAQEKLGTDHQSVRELRDSLQIQHHQNLVIASCSH